MFYRTVNRFGSAFVVWLWIVLPTSAQRIENIRPVANHDTITITYDLVGTQPGEQFKIRAFCWNGYEEIELKATEGRTIVGRGRQTLKWRVLDDVDVLAGDSITFTLVASVPVPDGPGTNPQDRRALLFSELTAKTDLYLEQLYNQAVLFRDFGQRPFESSSGYAKLDEQTKTFNRAYESLLTNRRRFEATVETLWGSSAGTAIETFFNDLFGKTHQNALMSYNDILKRMNDVVYRNYQGQSRSALVRDIQIKIYQLTKDADTERARLKNEAKALYEKLPL